MRPDFIDVLVLVIIGGATLGMVKILGLVPREKPKENTE